MPVLMRTDVNISSILLQIIHNSSNINIVVFFGLRERWKQTNLGIFQVQDISVSEFNEFELWLKSVKNRFQLSAGLNLEKLNTIFSGTNHI